MYSMSIHIYIYHEYILYSPTVCTYLPVLGCTLLPLNLNYGNVDCNLKKGIFFLTHMY